MNRLLSLLLWLPATVLAAEHTRLTQDQVDALLDDPGKSVALIESLDSPLAAGWKAYLQFTGHWPGVQAGPSPEIDQTMAVLRRASETQETESQDGHYPSLTQVLYDIRFTSEPQFIAPCWLFEKHPDEAGRAFGIYYGSGRDGAVGFCELDFAESEPFAALAYAKGALSSKFLITEATDVSEPGEMPWCGTIRVGIYREIAVNNVLSLFHPDRLVTRQAEIEKAHRAHMKTLVAWAKDKPDHVELLTGYETAVEAFLPTLIRWYTQKEGLGGEEATLAAHLWTKRSFNVYFEEDLRCLGLWNPDAPP